MATFPGTDSFKKVIHMSKKIRIIGVPIDLGASRRGVDMGPSACGWRDFIAGSSN